MKILVIDDPGGVGYRIESLYAFLATGPNPTTGKVDEGVIGLNGIPLIAADKERLAQLRPRIEEFRQFTPKPILLVQFTTRIDLETL